jgi:hypothetical protein
MSLYASHSHDGSARLGLSRLVHRLTRYASWPSGCSTGARHTSSRPPFQRRDDASAHRSAGSDAAFTKHGAARRRGAPLSNLGIEYELVTDANQSPFLRDPQRAPMSEERVA